MAKKEESWPWKGSKWGRIVRRGLAAFVASGLAVYILDWLTTTSYGWSGIAVALVSAVIMAVDKGVRDKE